MLRLPWVRPLLSWLIVPAVVVPVAAVPTVAAQATASGYSRIITVNSGNVTGGPLTNFPMLVSLSDITLRDSVHSGHVIDGSDIYFTDNLSSSHYPFEIESYNGTAGSLVAWVKVPSLTGGTQIKMWYGGSGAGSNNTTDVWSNGFQGVWHLKEDPAGPAPQAKDSTANGNNGTTVGGGSSGNLTQASGQIDGSVSFPGSGANARAYLNSGNSTSLSFDNVSAYTWEAWVKPAATSGGGNGIVGKATSSNNSVQGYEFYVSGGGGPGSSYYRFQCASNGASVQSTTPAAVNIWTHVSVVYAGASSISIYMNGSLDNSGQLSSVNSDNSDALYIGYRRSAPTGASNGFFNGLIDEVEYSNVSRSAGWIRTQYNNQSNPGNVGTPGFYTVGAEAAVPVPPSITTQPTDQAVMATQTANFTATASGTPMPTVQWQSSNNSGSSWDNVTGATSTTLSFAAQLSDNGTQYRAFFQNIAGNATSNAATLTVSAVAPVVTTQPTDQSVYAGQTATFTSAASGTPTPTVRWQVSTNSGSTWSDVPGATSTTLTLNSVTLSQTSNQYHAVFSNAGGNAASGPATLTVNATAAPALTTQPTDQTVYAGQDASFTAAASGTPSPTVQWQVSTDSGSTWSNLSGATSTTLTITSAALGQNTYEYHAVFTNIAGSATSNAATLTVNASVAPAVTLQPASQSLYTGQAATFSAAASGTPAPTVQWQQSIDSGTTWSDVPGATSTTLTLTSVSVSQNTYQYRAIFTNIAGSATSSAAILTVISAVAPVVTLQPISQSVSTGQYVTFSAAASGTPTPTVQWQMSIDFGATWTYVDGATSPTLSFVAQDGDSGKQFRAVFTNAAGSAISNAAALAVTSTTSNAGGVLAPAPAPAPTTPGTTYFGNSVDPATGTFLQQVTAASADNNVRVTINAGIIGQTTSGGALTSISIFLVSSPPSVPANFGVGARFYSIEPSGTRFAGDITITMRYDAGMKDPFIAWFNTATGQWERLTTVSIDTVNYTVTDSFNHFSVFGIFGAPRPVTTTPAPSSPTATARPTTPPAATRTPTATATPAPSTTQGKSSTNIWPLIVAIVAAVVVIVLVVYIVTRRKKTAPK